MTKLSVFTTERTLEIPEKEVFLVLDQEGDYIRLRAVNRAGGHEPCGNLMKFYPDGTFAVIEAAEIDEQEFKLRGS